MKKPKAILIDAMHLCYRHYHVMKLRKDSYKDGLFIGFYQGIFRSVRAMRHKYPTHDIYFLWDSPRSHRFVLHPGYKKRKRKPEEEEKSKLVRIELAKLIVELKVMLKSDGINSVISAGYEADDIARYMVERCFNTNHNHVVLWTGDLDWAQLIMDQVIWVNVGKSNLVYDEKTFTQKYGYPPEGIRLFKALTGDKSDNIKGIRLFPKEIAKTLASRTPSVEGLFYDRAILNDIPEKWRMKIREHAAELRLNYQLVSLMKVNHVAIDCGEKDEGVFDSYLEKYDIATATRSKTDEFYLRKSRQIERSKAKPKKEEIPETFLQW